MKNLRLLALLISAALLSCEKEEVVIEQESCYDLPSDIEQLACFECDILGYTYKGEVLRTYTVMAEDTVSNPWGIADSANGDLTIFMKELRSRYRALNNAYFVYLRVTEIRNLCTNNSAFIMYTVNEAQTFYISYDRGEFVDFKGKSFYMPDGFLSIGKAW